MKGSILIKKVEFDYASRYSELGRHHCPYCSYGKKSKSKTYKTLKSLLFHVKHDHKDEDRIFPFSVEDIHSLMHAIAFARQLKVLEN